MRCISLEGCGVFRWHKVARLFVVLALSIASVSASASNVLLVMGDSLSAAYGVSPGKGWVDLLTARLERRTSQWRVVNASVSGDTTTGGAQRIGDALKRHGADVVIIELGGNDALRGQSIELMRNNLTRLVQLSREANALVLMLGMRMPPNYGEVYARAFEQMYSSFAGQDGVRLVPFFLDGVALDATLMQDDGIHPSESAQPRLLDNVWPQLLPLLDEVERRQ